MVYYMDIIKLGDLQCYNTLLLLTIKYTIIHLGTNKLKNIYFYLHNVANNI